MKRAQRTVQPAQLPRGHGETVLVIGDEAAIRQITQPMLETFDCRVLLRAQRALKY